MKTKKYLIAIAITLSIASAKGQITGGGNEGGNQGSSQAAGNSDKYFYMRGGFSMPTGIFAQKPIFPGLVYPIESYNGKNGMGAVRGGIFEMGALSYFKLPFHEKFKMGIDFTYLDMSWNQTDWSSLGTNWVPAVSNSPFMFFGMKLGPVFSYTVIDNLAIDGFYKLNPVMFIGGSETYDYYADLNNNLSYSTRSNLGFGLRHSLGLNASFYNFMLGVEYNFGNMKYEITEDWSGKEDGSRISELYVYDVKTPVKKLYLTLGFKFKMPAGGMGSRMGGGSK